MKILLINKFHYMRGGSETYYFALAEALKAKGHDIIFFSMKDEKNIECKQEAFFVPNIEYNNCKGINKKINAIRQFVYSEHAARNIEELIIEEKPDIAHIGLLNRQLTFSVVDVLKDYNIPMVMTMHDLIFACPNYMMLSGDGICSKCLKGSSINCILNKCVKDSYFKSMLASYEKWYLTKTRKYEKIDLYIAECDLYRQLMIESGFAENKVKKMTNFLPINQEYRYREKSTDYVLYYGRFSREKGILTLLKAHKENNCKYKLVLVGDGPYRQVINEFISKNNLVNIEMPGAIYGEEMDGIIDKARTVVIPSEWYENCPYTLLQAEARGKLIIASNIAGLGELVANNDTGFLFETGDYIGLSKIIDKVMNMGKREFDEMSNHIAREASRKYNWEKYVDLLIGEYYRIIGN